MKFYCLWQRTSKRENDRILLNFQVPLNTRTNSNFGAFGGPGLHGPSGHYVGPQGCPSTRIVTK